MLRLVLAVVLAALAAPLAAAAPARSDAARLVLLDRSPLVVRGAGFRAGERVAVRVVVRGGPNGAKTVTAGARGTWVARFLAVQVGHCGSFVVRATGSRGSRASYTEHLPPCGAAP